MKHHLSQWWAILAMLAALATVAACDDDTAQSQPATDAYADAPDNAGLDVPVDRSNLQVFSPPNDEPLRLFYNSDSNIIVGYFDPGGAPISGANLSFSILSATQNCHQASPACVQLDAFSGTTDSTGQVTMRVRTASQDADVMIEVGVQGNDAVQKRHVLVQARTKESYDLQVIFEYNGARVFTSVKPLLFEAQTSCADVFTAPLRDPRLLPTAARQNPPTPRATDGTIAPSTFTSLPNFTAYVAVGYAETASGLVTVYGCNDERPEINTGLSTTIVVQLEEVPIRLSGIYKLTSNFNLLSGLPRRADEVDEMEAGDYVDYIIMLFTDPGQAIWDLLGPYINEVGEFDIPDALNAVAVQMINDAIENTAPDWLEYGISVGGDISELFTNLQLQGEFVISEEPNLETGVLPMGQIHRYTAVNFRWRLACVKAGAAPSDCNTNRTALTLGLLAPNLSIEGTWDGSVVPCTGDATQMCLVINEHGMTIPYGLIALAVVEGYVLPEFFGPTVDSIEKLIEKVLLVYLIDWYNGAYPETAVASEGGCESVGQLMANFAGEGFVAGVVQGIGEYACDAGTEFLVTFIRDEATALTAQTDDNLLLSTAGDCVLYDISANLEYDHMGSETNRCDWGIKFRWDENSDPIDMEGAFDAIR